MEWDHQSKYIQTLPIPNQFALTLDEVSKITNATTNFNQIIAGLASGFHIGLVDMNANFKNMKKGIVWDGITLNLTYVTGGLFSLDGIHPNPRGCAVAANYFIDAINSTYGCSIPHADVTKYPGVISHKVFLTLLKAVSGTIGTAFFKKHFKCDDP